MQSEATRERYTAEFFARQRASAGRSSEVVVPLVLELVSPKSIVDVGCGVGAWLAAFSRHGIDDVLGIDGDYVPKADLQIPAEKFLVRDLRLPLELSRRFDLVLALEVAEHLPPECASAFVESLTRLGPLVFFSAAIPGQGGTGHINEQWPCYWSAFFALRGYVHIDCLRRKLWHRDGVAPWYAQNMILYVAREELARRPSLGTLHDPSEAAPLSLVHPTRYMEWVEWAREHRCS